MRRLAATIRTDLRLQVRNGFYHATAFMIIASIVLLRWLPPEFAHLALPVVIFETVLVNSFYFVAGLLLLERVEGSHVAQSVTPLRDREYLLSKLVTLTSLSLLEGLLITTAVFGLGFGLIAVAIGVVLAAVPFCLAGIALALRHDSINEFLLPSVLYTFVLSLPILGLFGFGNEVWYWLHPLHGPLSLLRLDATPAGPHLVLALAYPLPWIALAWFWARSALREMRAA